jgi:amino acid adenylation domain-containing protein/thioester reductase-like protein
MSEDSAPRPEQLSLAKRALLELRLREARAREALRAPIPRLPAPPGVYELSSAQERFWILEQLDPGNLAHRLPGRARLRGVLAAHTLRRALERLTERHEALRTSFELHDGRPLQRVHAPARVELELVDLSALAPALQRTRSDEEFERTAHGPLDLCAAPPWRLRLVRLSEREHELVGCLHHILADGSSIGIFLGELLECYRAERAGEPARLAPLALQPREHAAWQRSLLAEGALAPQLAWWKRRLSGMEELELPLDGVRGAGASARGGRERRTLPAGLVAELRALCSREGATLAMGVCAAFQALLARWSGRDEIVLGTPVAGRSRAELRGLIGLFVNSLVLRTRVDAQAGFRALLARTREDWLAAQERADVPFERVVEELAPRRQLDRNPLFQVMFNMLDFIAPRHGIDGLELEVEPAQGGAMLDLALDCWALKDGLELECEHDLELFEPPTVRALLEAFEELLGAIVRAPDEPLCALPLIGAHERVQRRDAWERARRPYDPLHGPLEAFEQHAAARPRALALRDRSSWETPGASVPLSGVDWTYGELDAAAEAIATALEAAAGRTLRGAVVGVLLERSGPEIAALLASWKLGAAWLPLDPSLPRARLATLLADAQPAALLSTAAWRALLPEDAGACVLVEHVLGAQAHSAQAAGSRAELAAVRAQRRALVEPDEAAYLLYTSGSTGVPKGVLGTRRALANYSAWFCAHYAFGTSDRALAWTPMSFDVALSEIAPPLAAGGAIVIAHAEERREPGRIASLAAREHCAILQVVPSTLGAVLDSPDFARCSALRHVCSGGEPLTRASAERFDALRRAHGLQAVLWNMYGPSEACIDASTVLVTPPPDCGAQLPIGEPIGNARLEILDAGGRLLPTGLTGELALGGAGLALGYHGQPELSARRFIADPLGLEPGARLYRTGDRARRRADGSYEFRGRIDGQVKLRGQRLELGEIEGLLSRCAGVRQAAAVALDPGSAHARLFAFAAPNEGAALEGEALRAALTQVLPSGLVPASVIVLADLPRTSNDKLDRRALAELARAAQAASHARAQPAGEGASRATRALTPYEAELARLWTELLPAAAEPAELGPEDDFFALGGQSILAAQLAARARAAFGIELPLRTVFEHTRLGELALACEHARGASETRIEAGAPGAPAPLSSAQRRLWFLQQLDPHSSAYFMPAALRLRGELDARALERAFAELLARHEALRSAIRDEDGELVQRARAPDGSAWASEDLSELAADAARARVEQLYADCASRPFDLAAGELVRVRLLRLAAREHVLIVCVHHIAADGWSLRRIERELSALYAAYAAGRASPLAEQRLQQADWARWQHEHARRPECAQRLAAWAQSLRGAPDQLALPADRPHSPRRGRRAERVLRTLAPHTCAAVRVLAARERATHFALLLAAWQALLARLCAQDDLLVGIVSAGRPTLESESIVGLFASALPVRARIEAGSSFRALLARTRVGVLEALAQADLPFEQLVERLAPARDPQRHPLFQVSFDVLEQGGSALELAGLALEPLHEGPLAPKLELGLTIELAHADEDAAAGWRCALEYDAALFDRACVEAWADAYTHLLAAACAQPDRPVHELELVAPAARVELGTGSEAAELVLRFEQHARRAPRAQAVVEGERRWSYAELDERACAWAQALRERGAGPGTMVALAGERSTDFVAALLGIWKAGAIYLPIEASAVPARARAMLAQAGARLLIASAERARELAWQGEALLEPARLRVDEARRWLAQPAQPLDSQRAAYALFTSGTSGAPKAVLVSQSALAQHAAWLHAAFELGPSDVFLSRIAPGFDASLLELAHPFAVGASLALAAPGNEADPRALLELAARERVSVLFGVPSLLEALLREPGFDSLHALRAYGCGGEALPRALAVRFAQRCAGAGLRARLWNLYGPTEACIDACAQPLDELDSDPDELERASLPIGRPIAGARASVRGPRGEALPLGAAGELWLGGTGIALAYLGASEREAARLCRDPQPPHARVYASGDRARERADGRFEWLGRLDRQLKLRGRRIEPAEIEALLVQDARVLEAHVGLHPPGAANAQLAAWIRPARAADASGESAEELVRALRAELRARLPAPMVPEAWAVQPEFARGPTGKLDERELREPRVARTRADACGSADRAPESSPELLELCRLAGLALGAAAALGPDEDFFEHGGDSLRAIRYAQSVGEARGRALPLRLVFEHPEPRELLRVLAGGESHAELPSVEQLERWASLPAELASAPRVPARAAAARPPRRVLLTGATGFLGGFLAHELARATPARIDCLVRARDAHEAQSRLRSALAQYGLWQPDFERRLRAVPGALELPELGWSAAQRAELARETDWIVHCGARVDFLQPYARLAPANVEGTRELVRLAARGSCTELHFVSSIGVLAARGLGPTDLASEDDALERYAALEQGYEQTKWVAERMLQRAGEHGLRCSIYRPGRVAGALASGAWNPADASASFIAGCIRSRAWPALDGALDLSPVDWVAQAIVRIALDEAAQGRVYHLLAEQRTPLRLALEAARALGYALELLPARAWRARIARDCEREPDHPLRALQPLLDELLGAPEAELERAHGSDARDGTASAAHAASPERALLPDELLPRIDARRARAALARAGIASPRFGREEWTRTLSWWRARGHLPEPTSARPSP